MGMLQGYKHSPTTLRDMALVNSPAKQNVKLSITTGLQYPKLFWLTMATHYVGETPFRVLDC